MTASACHPRREAQGPRGGVCGPPIWLAGSPTPLLLPSHLLCLGNLAMWNVLHIHWNILEKLEHADAAGSYGTLPGAQF